jgi:hypothetical protein
VSVFGLFECVPIIQADRCTPFFALIALLDAEQNKVLAFSPKSCKSSLTGKSFHSLRECYNTNRENGKLKAATRHIPHTPERILDAPDLLDDFYINVMDWYVLQLTFACICVCFN